MSTAEKMAPWDTYGEPDSTGELYRTIHHPLKIEVPPRYEEVRQYILEGSAYKWYLANAGSSALLTDRRGTVVKSISSV